MADFGTHAVEYIAAPNFRVTNCEATTIHFSLPGCQQGQNRDYMAVIVPQQNQKHSFAKQYNDSGPPANLHNEKTTVCQDASCQYEREVDCCSQWSTEYRSTIDDCGRRVMNHEVQCRRSPIYPRCYFAKGNEDSLNDGSHCRNRSEIHPVEYRDKMTETEELHRQSEYPDSKIKLELSETKMNKERQDLSKRASKAVKPIVSAGSRRRVENSNLNPFQEMTGRRPMYRCFPIRKDKAEYANNQKV